MVNSLLLSTLIACSFASTEPSPTPVWVSFQIGGWRFIPIVSESEQTAKGFLAYYTGMDSYLGNLSTVLFERSGAGEWQAVTWPEGDLGLAASYVIASSPEGNSIRWDPVISEALELFEVADPEFFLAPEPYALGMSVADPMYQAVAGMAQPGVLLDQLRSAGYPVAPELPAIMAIAAARAEGDGSAYDEVLFLSLGAFPEAEPESVSLAAASLESDTQGTAVLLDALAIKVEVTLFGVDPPENFFWPCGCLTIYNACTWNGPAVLCRWHKSTGGQYVCSYGRPGVGTWWDTGDNYWLCQPCTGTGTYRCDPPCEIDETCSLFVPCPAGGCP